MSCRHSDRHIVPRFDATEVEFMARRRPGSTPTQSPRLLRFRPTLETLDGRDVPAAISWLGTAGDGLWSSAGNGSLNRAPTAGDDVTIDAPGDVKVTYGDGTTEVNSIQVRQDVLSLAGGSLSATS